MSKKDMIMKSSIEVFVEFGFHGAPVTKLIEVAGVSNGTFFYYFKTKEDLITAIYVEIKKELYEAISLDLDESHSVKKNLYGLWRHWVIWGMNNTMKFKFIEVFANSPYIHKFDKEAMKKSYDFTSNILKRGIEEDVLLERDIYLLRELIYGSIRGTILYTQKYEHLKDAQLEEIFTMTWKSLV